MQTPELKSIKFDVFGRGILVAEKEAGWQVFYLSSDGKKRPARDLVVPAEISESELTQYLDDLCHEWATDRNQHVRRLD